MIVLVAGAGGRLGGLVVASLLGGGHAVRGLVRSPAQASGLEQMGATPLVGDLRGDVEWAADRCDAAIFAAGARHAPELAAIDGGGAAKLAEAADRFGLRRFILCSAVGAGSPERHTEPIGRFRPRSVPPSTALRGSTCRTILRLGALTDVPGSGRISTTPQPCTPVAVSRDNAARTIVAALERPHLARRIVHVVDGDRHIADALDAVQPLPLPRIHDSGLGASQAQDPPPDPEMLLPDAAPLDPAVEYEGEGPVPLTVEEP